MTNAEILSVLITARDTAKRSKLPVACQPNCVCLDCRLAQAIQEMTHRVKLEG